MVDVKALQDYMRTDDPDVEIFLNAAVDYTKKAGIPPASDSAVYDLLICMIAGHWYCNRGVMGQTSTKELPFGAQNLIIQLKGGSL